MLFPGFWSKIVLTFKARSLENEEKRSAFHTLGCHVYSLRIIGICGGTQGDTQGAAGSTGSWLFRAALAVAPEQRCPDDPAGAKSVSGFFGGNAGDAGRQSAVHFLQHLCRRYFVRIFDNYFNAHDVQPILDPKHVPLGLPADDGDYETEEKEIKTGLPQDGTAAGWFLIDC